MRIAQRRDIPGLATLYLGSAGGGEEREIEFVDTLEPGVAKAEKWVLMISTQIGCAVGCRMCDAGAMGYRGNLTAEEMLAQIEHLLEAETALDASRHPKLKIHFARMGEPALNPAVLEALRLLALRHPYAGLMPSLSTVAPKSPAVAPFFEELIRVKDTFFAGGRFQLQFSLHASDEQRRRRIVPIRKWTLEEISEYGRRFVRAGDRKITLNFALAAGETVDAGVISRRFDPALFFIKITPVNPTRAADDCGATNVWVSAPERTLGLALALRQKGFETLLSPSLPEEIAAETSCGQLWSRALKQRAALSMRGRRLERTCYVSAETLPEKTRAWLSALGAARRSLPALEAASCALLVVDMQEFFLNDRSPAYLPQARAVLPNAVRLAAAFRRLGRPVFCLLHAHEDPDRDGGLMTAWWRKVCVSPGPWARISPMLEARNGEVFRKCRYSAFSNPRFEMALRAKGVRGLVVAGVSTNLCVESTVRDAFDLGLTTAVVADATAAGDEAFHVGALRSLAQGFSRILSADEALLELEGRAAVRPLPVNS